MGYIVLMFKTFVLSVSLSMLSVIVFADGRFVMKSDDVVVRAEDIENYILRKIPEKNRSAVLGDPKAVRKIAENIYLIKSFAKQGRANSKNESDLVKWLLQYDADRLYMDEQLKDVVITAMDKIDWDARAKEVYIVENKRFNVPEKVKVSHVLIKLEERSREEALTLINEIREKAVSGADFNELAVKFSEDGSVERNGGTMDYFTRGRMVESFEKASFGLEDVGDISEVVETKFGFHIIKFLGRQEATKKSFELVKDGIIDELYSELSRRTYQDQIIFMRSKPDIVFDSKVIGDLSDKYLIQKDP